MGTLELGERLSPRAGMGRRQVNWFPRAPGPAHRAAGRSKLPLKQRAGGVRPVAAELESREESLFRRPRRASSQSGWGLGQ